MDALETLAEQVSALQARLAEVEAILAIQALKARYGELVDQRFSRGEVVDPATLDQVVKATVELFTEDAVWDGGPVLGVVTGREAIAERLRSPTLIFARHLFLKPSIQVDGARAWARWDILCPCRTADGRSWWMSGYEDDQYRREGGAWRHASMRLTTVFMAPAGEDFSRILV